MIDMSKPNVRVVSFGLIDQCEAYIVDGVDGEYVFDSTDNEFIGKKKDCIVVSWWVKHCEDCDPEQNFRVILKEDLDSFNPND
jgi:hypothetical protein